MLALLVVVLLVPIDLALRVAGDLDAGLAISLRCRVLGIAVATRVLRAAGTPAAAPAPRPAGGSAEEAARASEAPSGARRGRLLARVRRRLLRLDVARRVLAGRAVRISRPEGWVEFALEDLAETGKLYGFVCATAALLDPAGAVRVTPRWTAEDWLAADLALQARIHPLRLAVVLARLLREGRPAHDAAASAAELHARAG